MEDFNDFVISKVDAIHSKFLNKLTNGFVYDVRLPSLFGFTKHQFYINVIDGSNNFIIMNREDGNLSSESKALTILKTECTCYIATHSFLCATAIKDHDEYLKYAYERVEVLLRSDVILKPML